MNIYQIFYNDKTFKLLDKSFIPLENSNKLGKEWFEFNAIFQFLSNNKLEEDTWYGFLSPEFYNKTKLSGIELKQHLSLNRKSNVCLASSCFDQIAIYQNSFIQGDTKHPGLIKTTNYLLKKYNMNLPLNELIGHSHNTVFSNYVIAKKKYWETWYDLAKLFVKLEKNDKKFSDFVNNKGKYKNTEVKLGVFIQERFPNILLSSYNYNVTTILSPYYEPCNKLLSTDYWVKGLLQTCDHLKVRYAKTGKKELIPLIKSILAEINLFINDQNRKSINIL